MIFLNGSGGNDANDGSSVIKAEWLTTNRKQQSDDYKRENHRRNDSLECAVVRIFFALYLCPVK